MTKEPKLVRARQIPEWDTYDQEIARFAARISEEGGALAASVEDLAGVKEDRLVGTDGGQGIVRDDHADEVEQEDSHRLPDEL